MLNATMVLASISGITSITAASSLLSLILCFLQPPKQLSALPLFLILTIPLSLLPRNESYCMSGGIFLKPLHFSVGETSRLQRWDSVPDAVGTPACDVSGP